MSVEILVVDDSQEFARRASDLITVRTGLESDYATSPDEAQSAFERLPIAVVVLDQKMPLLTGTELFLRLRAIRSGLRAIMLTGEAGPDEVGAALNLGYHDYLPKSRVSELPQHVAIQYLNYVISASRSNASISAETIWPRGTVRRWLRRVEIQKVGSIELESQVVPDDSWVTVLQLNAGEERKLTYTSSRSASVTIEHESRWALRKALNLRAKALAAAIGSIEEEVNSITRKQAATVSNETMESSEQTFSLPIQTDADGRDAVRARHYQQASVRRKLIVTLRIRCRRCKLQNFVPVVLLVDTGLVATRHQDYLNDGSMQVVETGIIPARRADRA